MLTASQPTLTVSIAATKRDRCYVARFGIGLLQHPHFFLVMGKITSTLDQTNKLNKPNLNLVMVRIFKFGKLSSHLSVTTSGVAQAAVNLECAIKAAVASKLFHPQHGSFNVKRIWTHEDQRLDPQFPNFWTN